jgi:hypothetical protein
MGRGDTCIIIKHSRTQECSSGHRWQPYSSGNSLCQDCPAGDLLQESFLPGMRYLSPVWSFLDSNMATK